MGTPRRSSQHYRTSRLAALTEASPGLQGLGRGCLASRAGRDICAGLDPTKTSLLSQAPMTFRKNTVANSCPAPGLGMRGVGPGLTLPVAECGGLPWPTRLAPSQAVSQAHDQGQPPGNGSTPAHIFPGPTRSRAVALRWGVRVQAEPSGPLCGLQEGAGPAPGFVPEGRPAAPRSKESILAVRGVCSRWVWPDQDNQRRLEEDERQEEAWKEAAPGVRASTTLEARGGRVRQGRPPSTLCLPHQAQTLPAKGGPTGGRMGSECGGSVCPGKLRATGHCPGLAWGLSDPREKGPHNESTGRGQGWSPFPTPGEWHRVGTGRGV